MHANDFAWFFVPTFIFGEALIRSIKNWRSTKQGYPVKDLLINFSIGMIDRLVTKFFWIAIMFFAFQAIATHAPLPAINMQRWWSWPLAILLSDLAFYWYHRAGHEIRLFWAIHNVHHSSTFYNFSTSIRLSWFEGLFRWPFWIILPLAGFSAEVSMEAYIIVRLYQVLLHTEAVKNLGWLEFILSTPSHHRVHHARNPQYLDKNYGGITILWDRLFGTFSAEEEPVDYGLVKQLTNKNIFWINIHEFIGLGRDLTASDSWSHKLRFIFGKPGWTPEPETTHAKAAEFMNPSPAYDFDSRSNATEPFEQVALR